MRGFELFTSDKCGEPLNKFYKEKRIINNTNELKAAVAFDHVAAAYKRNTRKNDNYIQSNVVMFDVDNTDSDKPGEWITYDSLRADFPNTPYFTVTSRNHMKEKDGKAPRPRFHVYFPIEIISCGKEYTALKKMTKEIFTYFDKYAADTARFFFGNPGAEVLYFDGDILLADYMLDVDINIRESNAINPPQAETITQPTTTDIPAPELHSQDEAPATDETNEPPRIQSQPETASTTNIPAQPATTTGGNNDNSFLAGNLAGNIPGAIPAGQRNATLSKFAFTMLVKYGDCKKSRSEYVEQSKKCVPPLEAKEITTIWERAVQAYLKKIAGNSGYIPPKEYAQWGEIQPIDVITPPPFPYAAFPATLAEYMQSISEYTQTAPEMTGVLVLGALGAVFQKKYNVLSINKNTEQLSIYAVAISPPAERKSEVIRFIISPFLNYQNYYNHENKKELSASEATRKSLKAALNRAESKIDGTKEKDDILIKAQEAYDNYKPKHALTLLADDTTSEALITLMANNGERILIASGEGGVFSNMKGRYKSGGDEIEIYLKGHSGDYISVHRKSREPEELHSPAISMAICVQPYVIHKIVMDDENTGKGLTGRIVFAYPAARAGTRKAISDTQPIYTKYNDTIFYMLKKVIAMEKTKTLKLSDEAKKYAVEYFDTPEKRIEDGLEKAKSWNGKAFGLFIRIAGLFHAFQCYEDEQEPAKIPISEATARNAALVTECLAEHSYKVFAGEDERNNDAIYLLRRITKYGQRQVAKQKMWQGTKSKFRTMERLNEILNFLEERGYLRVEKNSTGGRPADYIKVNPALLGDRPPQ